MTLKLTAQIVGSVAQILDGGYHATEVAVTRGVTRATNGLKLEYRKQMTSAGLGRRLANTWRSQVFPKSGNSAKAAGLVYSKAPKIVEAFAFGAEIAPRNKQFMAIPTEAAEAFRRGRRRITPAKFPKDPGLFFVRGRRGGGFLAIKVGDQIVPMFWLVSKATIKRRLNIENTANKYQRLLPALIAREFPRS